MEKTELIRIAIEIVGSFLLVYLASKTFKFKDSLSAIISAAKDAKVTEEEFQNIIDKVKKDIYG